MTSTSESMWLDARYIDDHVLLNSSEAWTFVMIPGVRTNMPTQETINYLVTQVERIIDGVGEDTFELHYHVAYRELDTQSWADRLNSTASDPTPAWADYLERMRQRVRTYGFQDRVIYLGIRMGSRTALEKPQLRGAGPGEHVKAWLGSLAKAAAGVDPQPSPKEVERWRTLAAKTRQALGASLIDAVPATASDLAWLIRHVQRLGMPDTLVPEKVTEWGAGTIYSLAEGVVDNSDPTQLTLELTGRNKKLAEHMEQYEQRIAEAQRLGLPSPDAPPAHYTSHVAILGLGDLPDQTAAPWLFHAAALPFPVEVSARIKVLSSEQAEKDAAKALQKQKNALEDAAASGTAGNSRDRRRAGEAASLHRELVEGRGVRQIAATYRLIVAGSTREQVGARAEEVIRHFREEGGTDITVQWAPGDQFALWEELIPGQKRRTRLWEQRQDLLTFAVGLPFSVAEAGDGEGPYVGVIEHGNPSPVFYDLATAAKRGRATTVAITGTLGGGKRLALDTPIPTPAGWTTMGDLREGDLIFDEKGAPCRVVHLAPIEVNTDAYEVVFDDGTVIVADGEHLWETHTLAYRQSLSRARGRLKRHQRSRTPHGTPEQVDVVSTAIRTEGPILSTVSELHGELAGCVPQAVIARVAKRVDAVKNAPRSRVYRAQDVERAGLPVKPGALYVTSSDIVAQGVSRDQVFARLRNVPAVTDTPGSLYNRITLLHALESYLKASRNDQRHLALSPTVVTTEEIRRSLTAGANSQANHAVPVAGAIDLPEAELPVGPYTLGAWLGDGHTSAPQITTMDDEILLEIESEGYHCRRLDSQSLNTGRAASYRIENGRGVVLEALRSAGVLGDKHIPAIYLRSSIEQRRALLAGLLDTDGTCTTMGKVEFVVTNERLARDTFELVASLGHKPTLTSRPAKLEGKVTGTAWKVSFTPSEKVFRLTRKLSRQATSTRGVQNYRYIVDVRPVAPVPMRCIQVDSPTHLYLAGPTFVPTHNTFLMLTLMDHMRLRGYPIIALDPKGDIKGSLLLKGRGDARFFDLSNDGKPGSLDPFRLVPYVVDPSDPDRDTPEKAAARWREETRTLVSDVLDQLLAGVSHDKMSTAVALALNAEMEQPRPNMAHLLEVLRVGGTPPPSEAGVTQETISEYRMAAVGAHAHLKNAAETQLGRLMFAPATSDTEDLFSGGVNTTVVSLSGLDLPRDGAPPKTISERFSVALFSLVAHQSRRMLHELDYVGPRALIIDEAHQITGLQTGRSLIVSNARMGRSRDIAMILATQSTSDLLGDDLRNVISTVFAFRTSGTQERLDVARMLGREPDDAMVAALLPDQNAKPGRCLFLDLDMNLVSMRVDRWASEYDKAFDTNPDRQNISAAGTRIETDAYGVVRDPYLTRTTPQDRPSLGAGFEADTFTARPTPSEPASAVYSPPLEPVLPAPSPTVQVVPPPPVQNPAPVPASAAGLWPAQSVPSPVAEPVHHFPAPQVHTPPTTPVAVPVPETGASEFVENEGWWTS